MRPSNTAVQRAGEVIRAPIDLDSDPDVFFRAVATIEEWRSSFAPALNATMMWLKSALEQQQLGSRALVLRSRHKKAPSVFQKLRDRPTMRAPQMEDIAGCRVVLPTLAEVRRLEEKLKQGRVRKVEFEPDDDYNVAPRPGGYRALHLHTRRTVRIDGREEGPWRVEIQLRTRLQHLWAESVEEIDRAFKWDIKHEDGPELVLDYYRTFSAYYADRDHGRDARGSRRAAERATGTMRDYLRGLRA